MKPRILIADDHAIVRDGLQRILERNYDILAVLSDGRELVREAERSQPDIVLTDISMPLLNGVEATRQIRRVSPRTKIAVLTMHVDVIFASEVFEAGASAYILKTAAADEIENALRRVLAGKTYAPPQMEEISVSAARKKPGARSPLKLTVRQREVLQLLAEGKAGKEIADILCVSPRTVEFHKYTMMRILGIASSAELVRFAVKHRLVTE